MDKQTPSELNNRLHVVWQRGQRLHLFRGLLSFARWATIIFLGCLLIDWLFHFSSPTRFVLCAILIGFSVFRSWRSGWRFLTAFDPKVSALKVEDHYKNFNSLLVTGVQLQDQAASRGVSDAMVQKTIDEAEKASAPIEAEKVIPFDALKQPGKMVAGLLAIVLLIGIINGPLLSTGLARILTPWQNLEYPTRTEIELAQESLTVKEGDAVKISAKLSGEVPANAELYIRTDSKSKPRARILKVNDDSCEYKMSAAFRSFDYALKAGDAKTKWHSVQVITSPQIETSAVKMVFPSYMKRGDETIESLTLTTPENSQLEWTVTLDRPVSKASFAIEGSEATPAQLSKDGKTVTYNAEALQSRAYTFQWVDKEHGFEFESSKHYLQVNPDQAPHVELTSPHKNLYATLGRQLSLAFKARDDHGIGSSTLIYRHNNAAEKSVAITSKANDKGTQMIVWDYRKEIEGLAIGDTLTFSIEVSDAYPGEDGPHKVRSQARRIAFLSREDYLEKIHAQKERLLARLRTVYRQERSAYDTLSKLDPKSDSFEQSCFLESSRQDITSENVDKLNSSIQEVIDDLVANNITDESELASLHFFKEELSAIRNSHIQEASKLLRTLGPSENAQDDLDKATRSVNQAASDLGQLVIRLGIHQAMEVFTRELHVIIQSQNSLRNETMDQSRSNSVLIESQSKLKHWLNNLLDGIQKNQRVNRSPLATIRLSRMVSEIRAAKIDGKMDEVAKLIGAQEHKQASDLQYQITKELFQFEAYVRVGAEYEALMLAKEYFKQNIESLKENTISENDFKSLSEESKITDIKKQLSNSHKEFRRIILPIIPAPDSKLLDKAPNAIPAVDPLIENAYSSLNASLNALKAKDAAEFTSKSNDTIQNFSALLDIINKRIEDKSKIGTYAALASETEDLISGIRETLNRQLRITEKTEDAEADEQSAAYLAPTQLHLSKETLASIKQIRRKSERLSFGSKLLPAALKLMEQSTDAMKKASPALKENDFDTALEQQDLALDALERAIAIVSSESEGWVGLANFLMSSESAGLPAKCLSDMIAEQRNLSKESAKPNKDTLPSLIIRQKNLGLAVLDIVSLLDASGNSMDFEQAINFAASDMGLAAMMLEKNQPRQAVDAQVFAADSLKEIGDKLDAADKQFAYFVLVLEQLQTIYIDAAASLNSAKYLRVKLESEEKQDHAKVLAELKAVEKELGYVSDILVLTVGRKSYNEAKGFLTDAINAWNKKDQGATIDALYSAEDSFNENVSELKELIVNLGVLPGISPAEAPEEYFVLLETINTLLELRNLYRGLHQSSDPKPFVVTTSEIEASVKELVERTRKHQFILGAQASLAQAKLALQSGKQNDALKQLYSTQSQLRHCIMEYILYYIKPKPVRGKKKSRRVKKLKAVTMFRLATKMTADYDKNWGGVGGDEAKAGRTDWEVLGERNRAALHENFVRELPLEYREVLKDYYERLTQ